MRRSGGRKERHIAKCSSPYGPKNRCSAPLPESVIVTPVTPTNPARVVLRSGIASVQEQIRDEAATRNREMNLSM